MVLPAIFRHNHHGWFVTAQTLKVFMDKKHEEACLMNNIKQHFFSSAMWLRILYMLVFYFVAKLAFMLVVLITILQAITKLVTGHIMESVVEFSQSLNSYILQIINFLTFHTEEKPFPFSDWPPASQKKGGVIIDYDDDDDDLHDNDKEPH